MAIPALGSILTFLISVSYGASELPCKIQAVEAALNERIVWITEDTLTRNHAILAAENPNTVAGLFGPDSIMWKIFRERAVKFGAALPYVLIQLGDPRVAYGVSGFSRVKTAPIDRLNATFGMMGNLIYGDRPTQFSIARKIFEIHRGVKGVVPKNIGVVRAGETFSPNNGELLRWSLGVLWHLGIKVQERFVGPLTAAEKVQFHKEMGRFNLLMGIPEELNPASYEVLIKHSTVQRIFLILHHFY